MLVHGEGDYLGQPFIMEPWQKRFVWRLYEYDPHTLRRLVRRALLILPKGCGKTELIAAICLAELAGPTSLDEQGNPVPRLSPNIPVGAASFDQAERLFGAARMMVDEGPLKRFLETFDTEIQLRDRPGRLFRVAAVAGTNDGGLPTCFGADEIHEWDGRKERVHLVIGNSLAKRKNGLELNISTPDAAEPESLIGKLHAHGLKIESGEVSDPTFLYEHHRASDHWNLDDPEQLRAAIREATPAGWVDVEQVAARYEIDRIPEHEFRRYHLAQFVRSSEKWLPGDAWETCTKKREVDPEEPVVLGFDGSYNNDSTALVGCALDGYMFVIDAWEKPFGKKGEWLVPRSEVDAAVRRALADYNVVEFTGDPSGWHIEFDRWADDYTDDVVVHFPNSPKRMSEACSRFYGAVVKKQITHDGDKRLARHLNNAVVKETADGAYITKDGRHSPRKIDLAVAAVMAFERATWRREQEEGPPDLW